MHELPKVYDPTDVEPRWYAYWAEHGVFRAGTADGDVRPVYVIALPPPNVTGSLHMGHALMGTAEDVLIRHKRMQGYNTLWQPGTDHAGIATQTVVERQLRQEGKSRHDLGREGFVARVWQWKEQSGNRIIEQMRVLGCSADWDRLKFTMDPDLSHAVREAFVRLYEDKLIYRATRLINWCSDCRTALSDLEVENEEADGKLYEFAYQLIDGDASLGPTELVVATTRPETMLGDTAVAVHPEDPRYLHLHGKKLKHPFLDREVPVITDAILVDMKFGTGAVKVTPAHDFNDFATGKRHSLEEISILNLDGTLNQNAGRFAGLTVARARKDVKLALAELGLERGEKAHKLQVPRCQRCRTIVEPMISTQWFVKMQPLAEPALAAVRDGRTEIIPTEWVKTYEHWLTNIQDWCISRQLWWGHQIPAFYCDACDHVTVTRTGTPSACEGCGSTGLRQDPDVLDTWFSSGLWPFSTLGWPHETPEMRRFYPTSDLETGYDILFFWVARMLMMGLYFTGEVPFRRVLLHGMVVDETGEKMSKVKGNTLDPLDLIHGSSFDHVAQRTMPGAPLAEALQKFKKAYPSTAQMGQAFPAYGADSIRLTLCSYSPQAKRISLSPKRIEGYRNFCNKVYNAVRYSLPHIEGQAVASAPSAPQHLVNRWILSRLGSVSEQASQSIEAFRLDEASSAIYHFFWDELCDWYLEFSKAILTLGTPSEQAEVRQTLAYVVEGALRALHPFAPFLTEELWQRIPRPSDRPLSIALSPYPTRESGPVDPTAEAAVQLLTSVITAARTIRSDHDLDKTAKVPLELRTHDPDSLALLNEQSALIQWFVKTDGAPRVGVPEAQRPAGAVTAVAGNVEVLVGLRGLLDPAKEEARIERNLKKIERDIVGLEARLKNENFLKNAPADVVEVTSKELETLRVQRLALLDAKKLLLELN
ncbi:MAG: valine--tRNA ligase [Polyangiaceae bacterium]|nr:valine--tRNA ligase [Polyangiaceae bacterium]